MDELITRLPKAELHVHIEGTLEPEMMLKLARRNGVELPYADVSEVDAAYRFTDLQSFLDIYYRGATVLQTRDDFAELMAAYLKRAADDGVVHAEVFVDPQSHTERGIGFETFMAGFGDAIHDARRAHGITTSLILCFLRHLSGEAALDTISKAEPHLDGVVAVGLDSSEAGHPPQPYAAAYDRARTLGLRAVAHAGEEGPPEYITAALDVLGAERIDHGVRCLEDETVVARLRRDNVPLTVCPLSNVALKVVDNLHDHPLPQMMSQGLTVTINSDDPAYFGGYVADNYHGVVERLGLTDSDLVEVASNSITASFLDEPAKHTHLASIDRTAAVWAGK